MSMNKHLPKKVSLAPKKHHGFQAVLFLLGCLLPPLAVALRFGIGTDFFINTFLCICGYFPCHFHNFYVQNIRNNTNRARTPKWALKAGLVDDSDRQRRLRKNQWAKRFDERNLQSTHIGQALEDGEEGADYDPVVDDPEARERARNEGLWTGAEEEFYNPDQAPNQQRWHYPANFEGAVGDGRSRAKQAPREGDRWARAASRQDSISNASLHHGSNSRSNSAADYPAYPAAAATDDDVPEWGRGYGSKSKGNKKKGALGMGGGGGGGKKAKASDWAAKGGYVQDVQRDDGWGGDGGANGYGNGNGNANGYGYGGGGGGGGRAGSAGAAAANGKPKKSGDIFDHEF